MRPDDYNAFSEVVVGFSELKGKALSPAAIKLYWNAMQHWGIEEFRRTAEHLLRTCEFMPTPKDFEDARKAVTRPATGEAWVKVLRHCRGAYRDGSGLDEDGPIDRAVEALGGYRFLALYDSEKMPFMERRFAEHYGDMQESDDAREALPDVSEQEPRVTGPAREVLPKSDPGVRHGMRPIGSILGDKAKG